MATPTPKAKKARREVSVANETPDPIRKLATRANKGRRKAELEKATRRTKKAAHMTTRARKT
jgi:hypothetical protein